jgi:hypothetical protein
MSTTVLKAMIGNKCQGAAVPIERRRAAEGRRAGAGPALNEDLTRWRVPRIAASEGLDNRASEKRLDPGAFFLELAVDRCSGPQQPDRR